MQRLLSTYIFVSRKLTRELIGQIVERRICTAWRFSARAATSTTLASGDARHAGALAETKLKLASLHAPTSRDFSATREGGQPLSICEVERVRRIEAMDELKRAIDVAEELPFSRMIFHMGGTRETADPRKRDAAFSSLEHLILHAKHVGVTICVENTTSEMGSPAYLRSFVDETRLAGCALISTSATRISPTARKKIASRKASSRCANSSPARTSTTITAKKTNICRRTKARSIGPLRSRSSRPRRKQICR